MLLSLLACVDPSVAPPEADRPAARLGGPNPAVSFHTIDRADVYAWDSILDLYDSYGATMITSQNRPDGLDPADWARDVSYSGYPDGDSLADAISSALLAPDPPAYVIVDELKTTTLTEIDDAAVALRRDHPELAGKWGAYLVNGTAVSYEALQPALDDLLIADAVILPEMYVARHEYCGAGSASSSRDAWLAGFFRGEESGFQPRFKYLNHRLTALGSHSHLSPVFGVTDAYADGTGPSVFLDRMFYVWRTRSQFGSYVLAENGGPSAWKWDQPYESNTSRDLAWKESFEHYSVDGSTRSRLGEVSCP